MSIDSWVNSSRSLLMKYLRIRSINGRVERELFRPKIVGIRHDLVTSNYW